MASPVPGTTTNYQQASLVTSWNAFSGVTVGTGSIFIVEASNGTVTLSVSSSPDWTLVTQAAINGVLAVFAYTGSGAGSTSLTIASTGMTRLAGTLIPVTGGGTVYGASTTAAATTAPNPPNVSPGVGAKDFLAFAIFGNGSGIAAPTPPSGYTTLSGNTSAAYRVYSTYKALTAASSEDPGAASGGSTDWQSATILVEPSAAGSIGAASGTGTATAVGVSGAPATGAASGTGAATGVGRSTASSVGAATGTGTATAVGVTAKLSIGTASGSGNAAATSITRQLSVGSASGTSIVIGYALGGATTGTASGVGTATAVGIARIAAVGTASAAGTASASARAAVLAVGSASGFGAAYGVGQVIIHPSTYHITPDTVSGDYTISAPPPPNHYVIY